MSPLPCHVSVISADSGVPSDRAAAGPGFCHAQLSSAFGTGNLTLSQERLEGCCCLPGGFQKYLVPRAGKVGEEQQKKPATPASAAPAVASTGPSSMPPASTPPASVAPASTPPAGKEDATGNWWEKPFISVCGKARPGEAQGCPRSGYIAACCHVAAGTCDTKVDWNKPSTGNLQPHCCWVN